MIKLWTKKMETIQYNAILAIASPVRDSFMERLPRIRFGEPWTKTLVYKTLLILQNDNHNLWNNCIQLFLHTTCQKERGNAIKFQQ